MPSRKRIYRQLDRLATF